MVKAGKSSLEIEIECMACDVVEIMDSVEMLEYRLGQADLDAIKSIWDDLNSALGKIQKLGS